MSLGWTSLTAFNEAMGETSAHDATPRRPPAESEQPATPLPELSSALDDGDIARQIDGRTPAVFLDYDGTLSPIAERPELALLPPETLDVLERLAGLCTVAIISGRDLDDLSKMVSCNGLWLSGSHGFDIRSPTGRRHDFEGGKDFGPALEEGAALLTDQIASIPGAWVEPKGAAVAVHYRQTPDEHVDALERVVRRVAERFPTLKVVPGKKIYELRPDIEWNKGSALFHVMEAADVDPDTTIPIYVGDDVTDEDAFLAIRDEGVGVVVGAGDRDSAAHHRLADTDEVRAFLERLAEQLEGEGA
jgi:trehalose 6-phosphate phosphatase